jgi:hypothetical protein
MKSNFSAPSAPGHPQILVVPHLDNQLACRHQTEQVYRQSMSRTLGHKRLLPNNWIGEVRSTVGCRLRASARAPYMQLDNGTSTNAANAARLALEGTITRLTIKGDRLAPTPSVALLRAINPLAAVYTTDAIPSNLFSLHPRLGASRACGSKHSTRRSLGFTVAPTRASVKIRTRLKKGDVRPRIASE